MNAARKADSNVAPFAVPPVVKSVQLSCQSVVAFELFTRDIHAWWPTTTHSLQGAAVVAVAFEPRFGGRLYERSAGGDERLWGTVTAWEPPIRVAFTWHVGREPDYAQLIEVTFTPRAGGTYVELVHSGWERLGADAERLRDEYNK